MIARTWTHCIKEVVAVPVPCLEQLHAVALALGPLITIRERCVDSENSDSNSKNADSCCLADDGGPLDAENIEAVAHKVVHLTEGHDSEVKRGEVVVQEQLTGHKVEREVVERPSQDRHTNFIVEALEVDVVVVAEATLPAENCETLDGNVEKDHRGGRPPNKDVAN
jgi:hypothetical protein